MNVRNCFSERDPLERPVSPPPGLSHRDEQRNEHQQQRNALQPNTRKHQLLAMALIELAAVRHGSNTPDQSCGSTQHRQNNNNREQGHDYLLSLQVKCHSDGYFLHFRFPFALISVKSVVLPVEKL